MIGLAVAELMETLDQMKKLAERKKVQRLSEQLHETRLLEENKHVLIHAHHIEGLKSLVNEKLFSKKRAGTRLVRILFPTVVLALIGSGILMATEAADSDILSNGHPFTTCFYTSVITSLSIGYGDLYPTTDAGRGLFCIFIVSRCALHQHIYSNTGPAVSCLCNDHHAMLHVVCCQPFSVVCMLKSLDEVNGLVKFLRETRVTKITPISELLDMVSSGDRVLVVCCNG